MTELKQVYKCPICGNVVEVVGKAGGTLVCCGKPMLLLKENSQEGAVEKHIPVVEKNGNEVVVKVGEVQHPMVEEHYIQWIEVETENKVYRKFLKPNDVPEASFKIDEDIIGVRELCNIHGLWKK